MVQSRGGGIRSRDKEMGRCMFSCTERPSTIANHNQDSLNANCGKKEFTVPADLATGDYLIRAEEIALHAAGSPNGAQLYMTCYQVRV